VAVAFNPDEVLTPEMAWALLELALDGQIQDVSRLDVIHPTDLARVSGQLKLNELTLEITVELGCDFPNEPPYIGVQTKGIDIPHRLEGGRICFTDWSTVVVDRRNPIGVIRESLALAANTIEQGLTGDAQGEFQQEFGAYWAVLAARNNGSSLLVSVEPSLVPRKVTVLHPSPKLPVVVDNISTWADFKQAHSLSPMTQEVALYIPLKPNALVMPPSKPWTVEELRKFVIGNVDKSQTKAVRRLVNSAKRAKYLILRIPRRDGSGVLVAVEFVNPTKGSPLINGKVERIVPHTIRRFDRSYLLPRGGADINLIDKKVLVVGCGSVGGHASVILASSGVGQLTLVDHDQLNLENTFRHVLGRKHFAINKAEALKTEIELQFPYVSVKAIPKTIAQALSDGMDLASFDAVVVAIGVPAFELMLNAKLAKMAQRPVAVFTWLEPMSIGGHAVLISADHPGCLECLFEGANQQMPMAHRTAFAEPGQHLTRDLTGCGGIFTPFSALDAVRTAELAARLTVEGLRPNVENRLMSWKGSGASLETFEIRSTARFQTGPLYEEISGTSFARQDCPVCHPEATP
jgi:molybdopterin-synthase adenylyltransferase